MISYLLLTGLGLICHKIFGGKSINFCNWLEVIAKIEVGFRIITTLLRWHSYLITSNFYFFSYNQIFFRKSVHCTCLMYYSYTKLTFKENLWKNEKDDVGSSFLSANALIALLCLASNNVDCGKSRIPRYCILMTPRIVLRWWMWGQ